MHPSATSSSQHAGLHIPSPVDICPRLRSPPIHDPPDTVPCKNIQLISCPFPSRAFGHPTRPLLSPKCRFNRHLSKSLSIRPNSHAFLLRQQSPRVVSFPWAPYYPTMRLHNTSLNPLTFPKSTNNPPCHLRGHRQQFVENAPRLQSTNEDACPIIPRGWVEWNVTAQGAVRFHRTNGRGRWDKSEKRERKSIRGGRCKGKGHNKRERRMWDRSGRLRG